MARAHHSGKAYWWFWWVQNLLRSREDTPSVFDRLSYLVLKNCSNCFRRCTTPIYQSWIEESANQSSAILRPSREEPFCGDESFPGTASDIIASSTQTCCPTFDDVTNHDLPDAMAIQSLLVRCPTALGLHAVSMTLRIRRLSTLAVSGGEGFQSRQRLQSIYHSPPF